MLPITVSNAFEFSGLKICIVEAVVAIGEEYDEA